MQMGDFLFNFCFIFILFQLTRNIGTVINFFVFSSNVFIVLSLYQLVVNSNDISFIRCFKLLVDFVGIMVVFFIICCNSSEVADNCNIMIVNAINQCGWEKCNNQIRRDLCIMLRRVQQRNHMTFNQGFLVLSRPLFLKVVKLAYSFFNFMRFKTFK
uniref:Uncharacterized protein n=1 Tax=Cacopsylla melanoneura TaxID=428564 RepID=A0A8D8ZC84_9HEMI